MKIFTIITLILLFHCTCHTLYGQVTFNERMDSLTLKLESKADSLMPGLNEKAKISVVQTSIQDLLRGVSETHSLNINIDPSINVYITNNFTNVTIKDLLIFLCNKYHLDIEFFSNIFSIHQFKDPPSIIEKPIVNLPKIKYDEAGDLLTVDLSNDSLSIFVKEVSRKSNKNVLLGPNVQNRLINGYIANVPFSKCIDKIALTNGLSLEIDSASSFYILEDIKLDEEEQKKKTAKKNSRSQKSSNNNLEIEKNSYNNINISASNVPISEIIKEAAYVTKKNFIFFSKPEGVSYVNVKNISFENLLELLLEGTDHTFIKEDNVHIIGSRLDEGFRKTKLIKFQFRAVFEVEKSIPEALLSDIQVLPFEELNALIVSGSSNRVEEISSFLQDIDQPVPNITIDVMVIDVRKSKTLQTGINAFIGDTTITTSGKIYPGVNISMGSNSINSILNKLQSASTINLGRVKSGFYVKLQALEQNGNIKIKSTPKLSTLNGHEAELTIGESIYYQEKTQNVTGGVNPIITTTPRFNKVDANLTIKIKPYVSGDENVTLNIEAEFSDFLPPEINEAPPGNSTRKFTSQIRVKNEEMVLLGGLEETTNSKNHSGIPILSKIPILKWIFSSTNNSKSDNKLLVLIKPQILY